MMYGWTGKSTNQVMRVLVPLLDELGSVANIAQPKCKYAKKRSYTEFRVLVSLNGTRAPEKLKGVINIFMEAIDLEIRLDWLGNDRWNVNSPDAKVIMIGPSGEIEVEKLPQD